MARLKPWPKLFHNLRATRETELAASFPLHGVCEWIGNSTTLAAKHYLQVTDELFERAIKNPSNTQDGATRKTTHFSAQQAHADDRKAMRPDPQKSNHNENHANLRDNAEVCLVGDSSEIVPPGREVRAIAAAGADAIGGRRI